MKKLFCVLLPFLAMVLTASRCKKEDAVDILPCFTLQNDSFLNPRGPVQFKNCSQGASSFEWDFGDGATSNLMEPSHSYTTTGYYDVKLTAVNGDDQEIFVKRIRVDYPRFKRVRVLQMPTMNGQGVPYDPDGSGLDLIVLLTRIEDHGTTYAYPFATNVTLPYEFVNTYDLSINSNYWTFELNCWGSGVEDEVMFRQRSYSALVDSPVEVFATDSLRVEVVMEGAR